MPGCPDRNWRHPVLDFLPGEFLSSATTDSEVRRGLALDGRIRAACDLVALGGPVQVVNTRIWLRDQRCIGSVIVAPLERPAGMLGLLLVADEQSEKFGEGEERLLSAGLAKYAWNLEATLWEQSQAFAQALLAKVRDGEGRDAKSYPFFKHEIASIVGHELRVPLSVIKGYAGLLQAYGGASSENQEMPIERQRTYLGAIIEQTRVLEMLVNDLLDISRLQRGKLTLRFASVDAGSVCRQVSQLGQFRADQQGAAKHHVVCNVAAHLPPVRVDADRLRQVLMNIVENAIKYSPQGGRIELEARLREGVQSPAQICITVRDQGIGISESQFARLFQPFERLEGPTTSHIAGVGLGLYIARQLVEAMGGTLDLQSCEGSGTDVTISLPTVVPCKLSVAETVVQVSSLPV